MPKCATLTGTFVVLLLLVGNALAATPGFERIYGAKENQVITLEVPSTQTSIEFRFGRERCHDQKTKMSATIGCKGRWITVEAASNETDNEPRNGTGPFSVTYQSRVYDLYPREDDGTISVVNSNDQWSLKGDESMTPSLWKKCSGSIRSRTASGNELVAFMFDAKKPECGMFVEVKTDLVQKKAGPTLPVIITPVVGTEFSRIDASITKLITLEVPSTEPTIELRFGREGCFDQKAQMNLRFANCKDSVTIVNYANDPPNNPRNGVGPFDVEYHAIKASRRVYQRADGTVSILISGDEWKLDADNAALDPDELCQIRSPGSNGNDRVQFLLLNFSDSPCAKMFVQAKTKFIPNAEIASTTTGSGGGGAENTTPTEKPPSSAAALHKPLFGALTSLTLAPIVASFLTSA